ncbi:MAG: glycosyltransferase family 8 protein [Lentisphaerae bacterium]|nr:glycosyltransferase family 8 protein [Lentisphaerota bacterium]
MHTAVMLCSLFENNSNYFFKVYILTESKGNITDNFLRFINQYDHKINILLIDIEKINKFPLFFGHTHAVYYRLFLDQLLPGDLDKVIYLDTDIIVNEKIIELWNVDLGKHYLAAVLNCFYFKKDIIRIENDLKINEDEYFNSGVLVLNLKKLREINFSKQCGEWIRENHSKILYCDQDVINAVTAGNWLRLHPKFNAGLVFIEPYNILTKYWTNEEIEVAKKEPILIHFIGPNKPWLYMCEHNYKDLYFKFLKKTQWQGFKFDDKTLLNIMKKHYISFKYTMNYHYAKLDKLLPCIMAKQLLKKIRYLKSDSID